MYKNSSTSTEGTLANGRQFIEGDVSLGDILPNLLSEIYALVKKGNNQKCSNRILYTSSVKILKMCAKNPGNLEILPKCKWDILSYVFDKKVQISYTFPFTKYI